ncbi:glycoside hydrolase family 68 protein [Halobacillus litoralis]|uniref:glycoside hydrolase family 68 protein n=1 Tax=Halobacillus litoralis TaxID=45668 RepID=UPI001CD4F82E|nr:glycoside hydrolase family 68 protein [Halobacillus litoralis]MCA0972084.1 glycoside hydrolase family 68 protein [Halobacillus litoralis]
MKWNKSLVKTGVLFTLAASIAAGSNVPAFAEENDAANWTREMAQNYENTPENTPSNIDNFEDVAPDYWVWDTWPLRNRDGSLAQVNGYKIVFALTASKDYTWNGRHDVAQIRYFYSKDGKDWTLGGQSYDPDKAFGSRQWAGSAMLEEDGTVNLFYTATGRKSNEEVTYEQRLARTTMSLVTNEDGVEVKPSGQHEILLEADGKYYETQAQKTGNIIYSFRDPWFFQDPESGKEYLLFEGNTGGDAKACEPGSHGSESFRENHDVPAGSEDYNGNVGIAVASEEGSLSKFKLLPPLLEADCVNQQLERPHIVYEDGNYYLFTITHEFTFAPGLTGPDGLYGFVSEDLWGNYKPLNDNGLVVANPAEDPFQAYSWAVLPNKNVISFVNEYKDENGNKQLGGSFAPTVKIDLDGTETEIVDELAEGQIEYPEQEEKETTPVWSADQVEKFERTEDNTMENIDRDKLEKIAPELHVWDTWPLRNRDGSVATIDGKEIIFSLTAPADVLPGKRHDIAEIRYFYREKGEEWKLGGEVFPEGDALGSRQWAGSAMVDDGELHMFYTATGRKGEQGLTYEQRLTKASADIEAEDGAITFEDWSDHTIILEPEGDVYQTEAQGAQGDIAYTFRDPWFFQDPKTKEEYILFEANTDGTPAERAKENFKEFDQSILFNGSIGIAKADNKELTAFTAQDPLLEAEEVNQELERPHIVVKGGKYYLFTSTHKNKFAPGLDEKAEDGLYGFYAKSLKGDYKPLNESGLVLTNPEDNPYQSYSWMVLPDGKVISFANFLDLDGLTINEIGGQSEKFQFDHFGGTLAPTVELKLKGKKTAIKDTLEPGVISDFKGKSEDKGKGKDKDKGNKNKGKKDDDKYENRHQEEHNNSHNVNNNHEETNIDREENNVNRDNSHDNQTNLIGDMNGNGNQIQQSQQFIDFFDNFFFINFGGENAEDMNKDKFLQWFLR